MGFKKKIDLGKCTNKKMEKNYENEKFAWNVENLAIFKEIDKAYKQNIGKIMKVRNNLHEMQKI